MADVTANAAIEHRSQRAAMRLTQRLFAHQTSVAYALLLPSLILLAVFTYMPVLQVVWDSFHLRPKPGSPFSFAGLDNYRAILTDKAFTKALVNNLIYAAGTLVPSLVLALCIALALAQSTRLNAFLRAAFFLPVLIPLVAAASLFLFIFLPNVGLLDHHIGRFFAKNPN